MAITVQRTLLENAIETGADVNWPGGRGIFMIYASDWGTATATFQYQLPNGSWIPVHATNLKFTADGLYAFELPVGRIRVEITGGQTVGAYAYAKGV